MHEFPEGDWHEVRASYQARALAQNDAAALVPVRASDLAKMLGELEELDAIRREVGRHALGEPPSYVETLVSQWREFAEAGSLSRADALRLWTCANELRAAAARTHHTMRPKPTAASHGAASSVIAEAVERGKTGGLLHLDECADDVLEALKAAADEWRDDAVHDIASPHHWGSGSGDPGANHLWFAGCDVQGTFWHVTVTRARTRPDELAERARRQPKTD